MFEAGIIHCGAVTGNTSLFTLFLPSWTLPAQYWPVSSGIFFPPEPSMAQIPVSYLSSCVWFHLDKWYHGVVDRGKRWLESSSYKNNVLLYTCISFYTFSVSFTDRTLFEFYQVFLTWGLGIYVTEDKTETQSAQETCPKLHSDKTRLDLEFPAPVKVLSFSQSPCLPQAHTHEGVMLIHL